MAPTGNWSAQQLAEFLAALSTAETVEVATQRAVERAAEALGSEVGALVREDRVVTTIGFPPGRAPTEEIAAMVKAGGTNLELDGLGRCEAIAVPVEGDANAHLMLARSSGREFHPVETNLLRAMGRVLSLSLIALRTLAAEQERRRLLGRLSRIQRSISHHAPLQDVLDAITTGAAELLGDDMAGVVMVDSKRPDEMLIKAAVGVDTEGLDEAGPRPFRAGMAGKAVERDELIVVEDYSSATTPAPPHPFFLHLGLQAGMAAPVREGIEAVGALLVGSKSEGRRYAEAEREALVAFADHASLALTDARLLAKVERALHDPLTGLPNRAFLLERLEERLGEDTDGPIAVVTLDLDSFKDVNDRLGPAAGDELLVGVAGRLRSIAGPDNVVARLGGDEFAILPAEAESAGPLAEAMLAGLKAPLKAGGRSLRMTASIGIASDGATADEVLRNADLAVSRAEVKGGMRCVVYEPRMHAELVERLELQDDLVRALGGDELEAYFQPKVEIATRRVIGVEALVRWRHPERGMLAPDVFIGLAEAHGLMGALTRKVLEQSLDVASAWWHAGRELTVSVNLSPATFDEPDTDLPGLVALLLASHDLPGRALQFEVTENALMRDDELAARSLASLSELGVGLSIDDFGTGYSSLSRLKKMPIDELKIDRSFVMELTNESEDLAIVRAAIELAHSMGLGVVAEGVETETAWNCLSELGCERAQGYRIAKPLPRDQLEPWLERWEDQLRAQPARSVSHTRERSGMALAESIPLTERSSPIPAVGPPTWVSRGSVAIARRAPVPSGSAT